MKKQIIEAVNKTIYRYIKDYSVLQSDETLQDMIFYALGFEPDGNLLSGGKRLRPLFCCLVCGLLSGHYEPALSYGAALEMLHNYTLVHDDIEDNSDTRHNRPALWKKYGLPLAINAGDLLYTISLSTAQEADGLSGKPGLQRILKMSEQLHLGQHRDISFENRYDINESEYLRMVWGKTAALIGCSFALGALVGGADEETADKFEYAGQRLGIAFQIRDDYLGTWGNYAQLGKSVSADIMDKKNTLAVVYTALESPAFLEEWQQYDGSADKVVYFADMMRHAGAADFLNEQCKKYTEEALDTLKDFRVNSSYELILDELISSLLDRKS